MTSSVVSPETDRRLPAAATAVGHAPVPEAQRTAFRTAWDKLAALQERMEGLGGDERRLAERADFLRFQLDELAR